MRAKSERIHLEKKKIKKRLAIVKLWRSDDLEKHPLEKTPHKLHKWNLNCGCKMCKYYKHIGNSKKKKSHRDNKLGIKD